MSTLGLELAQDMNLQNQILSKRRQIKEGYGENNFI